MKRIFCLIIFFLSLSSPLFSQSLDEQPEVKPDYYSRGKLSLGYATIQRQTRTTDLNRFNRMFINLQYHISGLKKSDELFTVRWHFAPGLNFVFAEEPFSDFSELNLIANAKFGPEMNINKNIFVSINLGTALGLNAYPLIPYAGISGNYLYPVSKNFILEFEGGINTTYLPEDVPFHLYLSVGAALD